MPASAVTLGSEVNSILGHACIKSAMNACEHCGKLKAGEATKADQAGGVVLIHSVQISFSTDNS